MPCLLTKIFLMQGWQIMDRHMFSWFSAEPKEIKRKKRCYLYYKLPFIAKFSFPFHLTLILYFCLEYLILWMSTSSHYCQGGQEGFVVFFFLTVSCSIFFSCSTVNKWVISLKSLLSKAVSKIRSQMNMKIRSLTKCDTVL